MKGLISWLDIQPGHITFLYVNPRDCLAARYCKAHGLKYGSRETGKPIPYPNKNGSFRRKLEYVGSISSSYKKALEVAREI
jgi:hypothetical protein